MPLFRPRDPEEPGLFQLLRAWRLFKQGPWGTLWQQASQLDRKTLVAILLVLGLVLIWFSGLLAFSPSELTTNP